MTLHKKFTLPSPKAPHTPLFTNRDKTPRIPHSPLTPLTPIRTNGMAAAHGSLSSVQVSSGKLLEESVMNWFSEKEIYPADLGELKSSILGFSR